MMEHQPRNNHTKLLRRKLHLIHRLRMGADGFVMPASKFYVKALGHAIADACSHFTGAGIVVDMRVETVDLGGVIFHCARLLLMNVRAALASRPISRTNGQELGGFFTFSSRLSSRIAKCGPCQVDTTTHPPYTMDISWALSRVCTPALPLGILLTLQRFHPE